MTLAQGTVPRIPDHASPGLILAAHVVRKAAELLAEDAGEASASARYLLTADRLGAVIGNPHVSRRRLILASPALTERSGRNWSLVEMIEAEPGDDASRLRLAKLLFRALLWHPETFPMPAGSASEAGRR